MSNQIEQIGALPTDKGKEKYPPNGYYDEDDSGQEYPCTCEPDCKYDCKGECGCYACHWAYVDVMSLE